MLNYVVRCMLYFYLHHVREPYLGVIPNDLYLADSYAVHALHR